MNESNWVDYIFERFNDKFLFTIDLIEKEEFNIITIGSSDNNIRTSIEFILSQDNDSLLDIQFKSTYTSNSIRGYIQDSVGLDCNYQNILNIEKDWLSIPILNGWKETEYYFIHVYPIKFKAIYKSNGVEYSPSEVTGCLSLLLYPLSLFGLLCKKVSFDIRPMVSYENRHLWRTYGT